MGKIIISEKFLKQNFINVALAHANKISQEKGLNMFQIQNDINMAQTPQEFVKVFEKYFGDELKLINAL